MVINQNHKASKVIGLRAKIKKGYEKLMMNLLTNINRDLWKFTSKVYNKFIHYSRNVKLKHIIKI